MVFLKPDKKTTSIKFQFRILHLECLASGHHGEGLSVSQQTQQTGQHNEERTSILPVWHLGNGGTSEGQTQTHSPHPGDLDGIDIIDIIDIY